MSNRISCALNTGDVLFCDDTEASRLFMVTGRIAGDDDDSAALVRARSDDEAEARFIAALKAVAMDSGGYADTEEPEILVCTNNVVGYFNED